MCGIFGCGVGYGLSRPGDRGGAEMSWFATICAHVVVDVMTHRSTFSNPYPYPSDRVNATTNWCTTHQARKMRREEHVFTPSLCHFVSMLAHNQSPVVLCGCVCFCV